MTDTKRLTDAQNRARDWLPPDGSWKINSGHIGAALNSLSMAWPGCIDHEWGDYGPRGGYVLRWRLNKRGVEVREINND